MSIQITVNEMMIETTRRCNLSCRHCMRGKEQCLDISDRHIADALAAVDSIDTVTLTGGEPLLVPDISTRTLRMSREAGVTNYYIATNGTIRPSAPGIPELLSACREFPMDSFLRSRSIRISQTEYHQKLGGSALDEWRDVPEATIFVPDGTQRYLKRGNAAKNKIDADRYWLQPLCIDVADLGRHSGVVTLTIKMLHVSAKGQVFSDCNLSYRMMDRLARLQPKTANETPIYLGQVEDLCKALVREAAALVMEPAG